MAGVEAEIDKVERKDSLERFALPAVGAVGVAAVEAAIWRGPIWIADHLGADGVAEGIDTSKGFLATAIMLGGLGVAGARYALVRQRREAVEADEPVAPFAERVEAWRATRSAGEAPSVLDPACYVFARGLDRMRGWFGYGPNAEQPMAQEVTEPDAAQVAAEYEDATTAALRQLRAAAGLPFDAEA